MELIKEGQKIEKLIFHYTCKSTYLPRSHEENTPALQDKLDYGIVDGQINISIETLGI
jgi:hypothetical protein